MKIISWNVNGIRSVYRKGFLDFLEKEDPDILCLQEIKAKNIPQSGNLFSSDILGNYYLAVNPAIKNGYSGVAVFTKEKPIRTSANLGLERFDNEGRILELEFPKFTLINLYMPHGARDKHNLEYKLESYDALTEKLKNLKTKKPILCGDFNVAHKAIDLANPSTNRNNIMFTSLERSRVDRLINLGFIDTFREFNKEGGNYSWWPYRLGLRERNIGWRIDYIYISEGLKSSLKDAFILKEVYGSDHCPIGVEITI